MLSPSSVPPTRYCYWAAPLVIGRRHSVVVITGDFESLDAGSNPAGQLIISPVIVIGHYHQSDRQSPDHTVPTHLQTDRLQFSRATMQRRVEPNGFEVHRLNHSDRVA